MRRFKAALSAFVFIMFIAAPAFTLVIPQSTFAAATKGSDCEKPILGISPWFRGLSVVNNGQCSIASPGDTLDSGKTLDLQGFIWRIALNVIDIALAAVGYIAFFFVLYGGFQYLTGGSVPGQIEKARQTILNALIGLVISIAAVAVVNLIFGILG